LQQRIVILTGKKHHNHQGTNRIEDAYFNQNDCSCLAELICSFLALYSALITNEDSKFAVILL